MSYDVFSTKFAQKCSKKNPYSPNKKGIWYHPEAKEVGEQDDDWYSGISYQDYKCPYCGLKFTSELPQ